MQNCQTSSKYYVKIDKLTFSRDKQGRSHGFKSGGAQATRIILGPFYMKKMEGPNPNFDVVWAKIWEGPNHSGP